MEIYIVPTCINDVVASPQGGYVLNAQSYIPYSGIEMTRMIELGQKSKPRKNSRTSNITPKNPWTKNSTPKKSHAEFPSLKYCQVLNDITRKIKTIEKKKTFAQLRGRDHRLAQARNTGIGEHRHCCVTFEI